MLKITIDSFISEELIAIERVALNTMKAMVLLAAIGTWAAIGWVA